MYAEPKRKKALFDKERTEEAMAFFEDLRNRPQGPLRMRLNKIFEEPQSSTLAYMYSILSTSLVVASGLVMCIETLPEYYTSPPDVFNVLEISFVSFFSFEYMARLVCTPAPRPWLTEPLNIIDLLVLIPFYIELGVGSINVDLRVFRLFRIFRVFRLFKLSRYLTGLQKIITVGLQSWRVLFLILMVQIVVSLVTGSFAVLGERQISHWDSARQKWIRTHFISLNRTVRTGVVVPFVEEISPYQSFLDGMWSSIQTVTTVGYGDLTPVSLLGKISMTVCMLCATVFIAILSAVFGNNFLQVNEAERTIKKETQERAKETEDVIIIRLIHFLDQYDVSINDLEHNLTCKRILLWDESARNQLKKLYVKSHGITSTDEARIKFLVDGIENIKRTFIKKVGSLKKITSSFIPTDLRDHSRLPSRCRGSYTGGCHPAATIFL